MAEDTLPLDDEAGVVDVDLPDETPGTPIPEQPAAPVTVEQQPTQQPTAAMVPVQTAAATEMREMWLVAERVYQTIFAAASKGNLAESYAKILTGREIGLGPMASLKHVQIIDGRPGLSAEATLALIRRAGHKLDGEATNQHAEVTGTRFDTNETMTLSVTLDDALAAGWIDSIDDSDGTRKAVARSKKGYPLPWELHTEALLWARAVTKMKTRLFSDVTIGWFTRLEEPAEEI